MTGFWRGCGGFWRFLGFLRFLVPNLGLGLYALSGGNSQRRCAHSFFTSAFVLFIFLLRKSLTRTQAVAAGGSGANGTRYFRIISCARNGWSVGTMSHGALQTLGVWLRCAENNVRRQPRSAPATGVYGKYKQLDAKRSALSKLGHYHTQSRTKQLDLPRLPTTTLPIRPLRWPPRRHSLCAPCAGPLLTAA